MAGVTFLAVGNAACDVIASIAGEESCCGVARCCCCCCLHTRTHPVPVPFPPTNLPAAFSSGVPKVGVGTTIGAGIFVTTAVIAAVSFVADVRLARRSFMRDILFFIGTIVYLLYTTLDGIITLGEAIGFMLIYVAFVLAVAGPRLVRYIRKLPPASEEDTHGGMSIGGSTGQEGGPSAVARRMSLTREPSRMIADMSHLGGGAGGGGGFQAGAVLQASRSDDALLVAGGSSSGSAPTASPLDVARRTAMMSSGDRDMAALRQARYFAPEVGDLGGGLREIAEDQDGEDGDDDGDLGGGSGDASTRFSAAPVEDGTRQRFHVSGGWGSSVVVLSS